MTIKELSNILGDAKKVHLSYEGVLLEFHPDDRLSMAAYGKFVVDKVYALETDVFELRIASHPMVAE